METTSPTLAVGAGDGPLDRVPWYAKAACLVVVAGVGAGLYLRMEPPARAARRVSAGESAQAIMLSPVGWSTEQATGRADKAAGRVITLYKPSLELANYRVEFSGEIQYRAMGWVYRLKDPSNYYAAKLQVNPTGKDRLSLVRWKVVNGEAVFRTVVPLPAPEPVNGRYKVRLDVRGHAYTTYVQGVQADQWTDPQFDKGGFGFANENTERGKVSEVRISLLGAQAAN